MTAGGAPVQHPRCLPASSVLALTDAERVHVILEPDEEGGGRFIAAIVMFASVATVSLVTAVVTAGFVAYQQRRLSHDEERHQELRDALHRIEQRLESLER